MLLRLTSQDLFNTTLVDNATSQPSFHLSTTIVAGPSKGPVRRRTEIHDASGDIVGTIDWEGHVPQHIVLLDEAVGGLVDLFAAKTIALIPRELSLSTRFDTEFVWTATPEEVFLLDIDSGNRMAELHPPRSSLPSLTFPLRTAKPKQSSLGSSVTSLSATSTSADSTLLPRGTPFVSLTSHPHGLASDVELLVSLLMLDILRRGRFQLPAYRFGPPSPWREAWSRISRPRRNTV
ncbi:unnamed protein product [Mycena citricolor]|uniref:Uncharacterized protein n=1 Tax=Mycena citricolor TaxID=2018698 RepID=A0AAD2HMP6_9AGAR|nr:unnamed protein product [Mycena citricolor]